jgi:competence protein ComEC
MKILQFPIARFTLFFILGIILAFYLKPSMLISITFLLSTLLLFLFTFLKTNKKFIQNPLFGISLFVIAFAIGLNTVIIHNDTFNKNHYLNSNSNFETSHVIKLIIREKLKSSAHNSRYIANINQIDSKKSSGKIILNLKKDSITKKLLIGTQLLIEDQLVKNFKPNNPNQFDYGNYLESKGIYAQLYTDSSQIKISSKIEKDIWYYASNFRNKIVENLRNGGFKKEELAVVVALILGQQQDISPDVIKDYQYAGAVHILSVSGLHVGFIMLFISFLLKPLPKNKFGDFLRLLIIVTFLWVFAVIASLAPSVVRSATMFSVLALGKYLNREANMYNSLLISLFLILLFEPLFLFDIGFQLSYIAVFFILWLQPLLKLLWNPKNKILTYFWDILTVSFAAQIGALPLSIYYFHQFPGLFFITNLVLIPCLSIIMVLGVFLMLFAFLNCIPAFLSKIVEISIALMNSFIKWIASFESFIIKDIPLSFTLLLLLYLIIFTWIVWLKKPNYSKLIFSLISIFIFQIMLISTHFFEQQNKNLIVFNIPKKTCVGERNGSAITIYTNESLLKPSFEKQMLQSYFTANFIKTVSIKKLKNTLLFNNNKILIINKTNFYNTSIKPDVIIIKDSPKINMERLLVFCKPKIIIADASNYKSYIKSWKETCKKSKIPFHSTYEKGFYSIN